MPNRYIGLEDEILLRRSIKAAFKHEGWPGMIAILGELSRSIQIVLEVVKDIQDEEDKKEGNSNV
jgi:hypothetical protein